MDTNAYARGYSAAEEVRMNDQTADREGLAEAIRAKYDEHPPNRYPTEHALADHLLASPQFARIIAEAEARGAENDVEARMARVSDEAVRVAEEVWTEDEPTLAEYELTEAILRAAGRVIPPASGEGDA